MPELPEVETIRRDLEKTILKKRLTRVDIVDARVLRQPVKEFTKYLLNVQVQDVRRLGKALILDLDNGRHLIVHLMMTGQLVIGKAPDSHTRVVFDLSNGRKLLYNDQRVFGQLRVVKNLNEINYFKILGPEPFDKEFSVPYIRSYFKQTRRPIKNVLLDHTFVAGIGNIYACEILYRCGINPARLASRVKPTEIKGLIDASIEILNEAIALRGSSMRNYRDGQGKEGSFKTRIQVYAREGEPCGRCQSPIARIIQAGRSTFYCMKCQR